MSSTLVVCRGCLTKWFVKAIHVISNKFSMFLIYTHLYSFDVVDSLLGVDLPVEYAAADGAEAMAGGVVWKFEFELD